MPDSPIEETSEDEDEAFDVAYHISEMAKASDELRGATWSWTKWTPTPAILYEPETGPTIRYDPKTDPDAPYDSSRESPSYFDHDHCHFCYENRFSTFYEQDENEGWTTTNPPGTPEAEQDDYVWWVCTRCFELLREQFEWKTEPPTRAS